MNKPIDPSHIRHDHRALGRRQVLGFLGATGALLVVACGDSGAGESSSGGSSSGGSGSGSSGGDEPTTGGGGSSGGSSTGGSGTGGSTGEPGSTGGSTGEGSTGGSSGDPTGAVDCGEASAWASGGTAAMTAQDCYPDPFKGGVPSCVLICETTAGPCTTATTIDRKDVSEGFAGLPVRLALLVVNADTCEPVAGAKVEIWHTQRTGVYSGVTPNPQMCYGKDPGAAGYMYFRGSQTAGADGRVDFDTCFPGWYSGRAIHIHFRVYHGEEVYTVSQLFFDDALNAEIFASHPDYQEFGQPNTTSSNDNIIGKTADKTPYMLDVQRMPDGAMLASKVVAIRGSLQDPKCSL